ncbi:MAG: VWA domain-containing protein [Acetobacteraceae bacterium]|nr:VWA domain-containing protein [Acetobacteraceae bacterium]
MPDKQNFILVPDPEPEPETPPARPAGVPALGRVRAVTGFANGLVSLGGRLLGRPEPSSAEAPPATGRPRLVFGFDATASREPAWAAARQVTDALVRALPGELDVALAVHGGSRLHTFTEFTASPAVLRDRAAAIDCIAGYTQMLPILARALATPGVRVVVYIGDVFEESPGRGRRLADEMGRRGIRLFVLHDVADWNARRDAELFRDLARRTGGDILPFDANAPDRLRDLLAAVAVYAVGGEALLEQKRRTLPGAALLLRHLNPGTDR